MLSAAVTYLQLIIYLGKENTVTSIVFLTFYNVTQGTS